MTHYRFIPKTNWKYECSPDGKIRKVSTGEIVKTSTGTGYEQAVIWFDGEKRWVQVHRIVMLTFFGESELEVNHIDGNKTNNHVSNLEYVTRSENMRHAYEKTFVWYPFPVKGKSNSVAFKLYQQESDYLKDLGGGKRIRGLRFLISERMRLKREVSKMLDEKQEIIEMLRRESMNKVLFNKMIIEVTKVAQELKDKGDKITSDRLLRYLREVDEEINLI